MVISLTTNVFHEQPWAYKYAIGGSHYEYLVATYVTSGLMYTPLVVGANTAWHSKG